MKLLLYITLASFFIFQSKAVISQSSDSISFEQISQFIKQNEYQQALSVINQTKQSNDPIKKIRLLKYSAECHKALKNDYQLINVLNSLNELLIKTNHTEELKNNQLHLANIYHEWGIYEKAISHYHEYLKYGDHYSNEYILACIHMGSDYQHLHKEKEALQVYLQALSHTPDSSFDVKKTLLQKIADIYKSSHEYTEAKIVEMDILSIQKTLKDSAGISNTFNSLGVIAKKMNQEKEALSYFLNSYNYFPSKNKQLQSQHIILLNIGISYQSLSNLDKAEEYFNLVLNNTQKQKNSIETARAYNYLASNDLYKNDYIQAFENATKAISISKSTKHFDIQEVAYRILWLCSQKIDNEKNALEYYKQYIAVKDSLFSFNKKKEDALYKRIQESKQLESRIKLLMIENQLKEENFQRDRLETENNLKQAVLISKENELRSIKLQQQQYLQEKEISRLQLIEQVLKTKSQEQEINQLETARKIELKDKSTKLHALKQQNEISQLEITKKRIELHNQSIVQYFILVLFVLTTVVGILLFNRYKLKQTHIKSNLAIRNMEIEQRLLRTQMNPHFLFNVLNSIQYYIISNESKSAVQYLARFSQLVRFILESSKKSYISLEQEIKNLQIYLELEQLRLEKKFSYQITIDPNIDTPLTGIPPMLTQPFVENAIIHGIKHTSNESSININFYSSKNEIICTIEDNGIGRKASALINASKKHHSIATNLTNDRLELLNKQSITPYSIHIEDILNNTNQVAGTKVIITLPYIPLNE